MRKKTSKNSKIKKSDVLIVMPAYNESKVISKVIDDVREEGYENILIVDDGSSDNTYEVSKSKGVYVARHFINRGVGAATKTGFEIAGLLDEKYIVTMDSDGQHDPKDIINLITPLTRNYDVVIGSRFKNRKNMPLFKRFGNSVMNIITWLMFGVWTNDSQSGFKSFKKRTLKKFDLTSERYEVCSEIIGEVARNSFNMKEVQINTIYTKHSMSKGTNFFTGIKIFIKLIIRKILK
ncbi:MAG: glycosyltransferase family 2 protein [Candidatus Woesearchaeota archaeon]